MQIKSVNKERNMNHDVVFDVKADTKAVLFTKNCKSIQNLQFQN